MGELGILGRHSQVPLPIIPALEVHSAQDKNPS
jgi:hypothetical protein